MHIIICIILLFLVLYLLVRFMMLFYSMYYNRKALQYDLYQLIHQNNIQTMLYGGSSKKSKSKNYSSSPFLKSFSLWNGERKVDLIHLNDSDIDLTLPQVETEIEYISKNWNKFEKNYGKIIAIIHPFDRIKSLITMSSPLTKDSTFHPTNAFMKMYEALLILKEIGWYNKQKYIHQFDVAAAPGMFLVSGQKFAEQDGKEYDQRATSLILKDNNEYFQDQFGIFAKYPDKFINANLLSKDDILNKLMTLKFEPNLVSGDVGEIHNFDTSQEKQHHRVQFGQAYVSVKKCKKGGCVFLKMYSHIYPTSIILLNKIRKCFKEFYIMKPFTSRIVNHESYLLGIDRNDVELDMEPVLEKEYTERDINTDELKKLQKVCWKFHYMLARVGNNKIIEANDCVNNHKKYVDNDFEYIDYLMNLFKRLSEV